MKAIKLVIMNHTSNLLRDRNKTRKKANEKSWHCSAHDIANPNELPTELSNSIKTVFDAFWNIHSDDLLDIVTTQTNIYAKQHKGIIPPDAS